MYRNNYDLNDFFSDMQQAFDEAISPSLDLDILEEDQKYLVYVDVAGYKKEDIKLQFENNTLKLEIPERKSLGNLRKERARKAASRVIAFEHTVNASAISAKLDLGVLEITLPKLEEKKENTIAID